MQTQTLELDRRPEAGEPPQSENPKIDQPKIDQPKARFHFPWRSALAIIGVVTLAAAILVYREYRRLAASVDERLALGPYASTVTFYSAPEQIALGDTVRASDLAQAGKQAAIETGKGGVITAIRDRSTGQSMSALELQPTLLSNISASGRERRILVKFDAIPPVLVQAITSAEDRRFFEHAGFDPARIVKAAWVDAKDRRKAQGASTITMQLARNLYLEPEKRWSRKLTEVLIAMHLEHAMTKQQIFEYYANQVYLGGYGNFGIYGVGEAARAYFNKSVKELTLPEAATIAGLIQRPSYFNPFRSAQAAVERRNVVLGRMRANGFIDPSQYEGAVAAPLGLNPGRGEMSETQFSMDLADKQFRELEDQGDLSGARTVYTTIDMRLQRAAEQAVTDGMAKVDALLKKGHSGARAEAALIALDPHTGEIKAVVGGRDYGSSQFDRVLALRPPGSVFKPFVYAAALNSAIDSAGQVFTPASLVNDVPTTFRFDGQTWSPDNFKHEFHGTVSFRQALAHSLNVATVKVAQMTGFENVVALARQAGMNDGIKPTPAVALGTYQATPYEIARAYTMFANNGVLVEPTAIRSVSDASGRVNTPGGGARQVLDPRVNYLMVSMLQDVMKYGTAAGVRAAGFTLPAAGKTGTSHDGWFAGFTSQLLCIVWVGFDDYSQLGLEGAHSALPIWAEFMKDAGHYSPYREAQTFKQPDGIATELIDPTTDKKATPFCPATLNEVFVDGTEPTDACAQHEASAIPAIEPAPASDAGTLNTVLPQAPAPATQPPPTSR